MIINRITIRLKFKEGTPYSKFENMGKLFENDKDIVDCRMTATDKNIYAVCTTHSYWQKYFQEKEHGIYCPDCGELLNNE